MKYGDKIDDLRSKIEEFCKNSQDVLDKIEKVVEDENVKQAISTVAIIGPAFKLGSSIYDVLSKDKKSYDLYFLNKKALNAYESTIKFLKIDLKENDTSKKEEDFDLLSVLFDKVDNNQISETHIFSHPLVKCLEKNTLELFEKKNLRNVAKIYNQIPY